MEIPDVILDWDLDISAGRYDDDLYVETACWYRYRHFRPDGRCKTGIREWQEPCEYHFPSWSTPRELLDAIADHIGRIHSDLLE